MKVVTNKAELKVGDKLVFIDIRDNGRYTKFCINNNIVYVVVTSIPRNNYNILANFVNHKGRVIMRNYTVTTIYRGQSRFYYYEGS